MEKRLAVLNKLSIDNLKSIGHFEMYCDKVNLLVGTNSSGKSTVLQALLLMLQNMERGSGLNGDLVSLGSFEESRCRFSPKKEIGVQVTMAEGHYAEITIAKSEDNKVILLSQFGPDENSVSDLIEWLNCDLRQVQYLSCHRIGPQKLYEKNMSLTDIIGIDGKYAISFLDAHASDPLEMGLCRGNDSYTLLSQVNWWLEYIVDAQISTEEVSGADMINASYRIHGMDAVRPGNVGSGISYLISILVMCLSAPKQGVLIIENPEIHLHPSAQAKICEFFYFIAKTGRQLFLESHSDHIFNGFRAGMVTGQMDSSEINIQFLYLDEDGCTKAEKVEIGKYGKILNPKKDLFDQFDIDLNRMIAH